LRHRNKVNKLSRASDHRKALVNNIMKDMFEHESVVTTVQKAKAARPLIEKIITKGKKGDVSARRYINTFLNDKKLTNKVVDEISKSYANRPGGYTRILKLGQRRGDAAELALFQLVKE